MHYASKTLVGRARACQAHVVGYEVPFPLPKSCSAFGRMI
jgi:hypothetical protein